MIFLPVRCVCYLGRQGDVAEDIVRNTWSIEYLAGLLQRENLRGRLHRLRGSDEAAEVRERSLPHS